jgi:hypothetical protein
VSTRLTDGRITAQRPQHEQLERDRRPAALQCSDPGSSEVPMALDRTDVTPLEEPLAELERRIIDEYIRSRGHDPAALRASPDAAARRVLVDAAVYAATRLSEVEARSHYVRELHTGH